MKALKISKFTKKSNGIYVFLFRYFMSVFMIFTAALILLKFSDASSAGIKRGLELCFENLIPGLYPFMILTNIFLLLPVATTENKIIEAICQFLFKLPGKCFAVIVFSFIGGLPIGAGMTADLHKRGELSREQAGRLLCFCVNPGPAFIISVVGGQALGSTKLGVIIFFSLIISSLIIGVSSRFFAVKQESFCSVEKNQEIKKTASLVEAAVIKSSRSILSVCSWVVAFSCICELIDVFELSEGLKSFLLCVTEMTRGSFFAAEELSAPIVAAIIGFSGFCGHFQLMASIKAVGLPYKYFLALRIINSALSAVICSYLLELFPVTYDVFSLGNRPVDAEGSGSLMLSFMMIVMALLFVVGDDCRVMRKKVRKL